jgi:hypothetical protein
VMGISGLRGREAVPAVPPHYGSMHSLYAWVAAGPAAGATAFSRRVIEPRTALASGRDSLGGIHPIVPLANGYLDSADWRLVEHGWGLDRVTGGRRKDDGQELVISY